MEQQTTRQIESVPGRPWWWQWPTILALDAPAVATGGQGAMIRITLPRAEAGAISVAPVAVEQHISVG